MEQSNNNGAIALTGLIAIAQIVLGALSLNDCDYGAEFSIVSGSIGISLGVLFLIGFCIGSCFSNCGGGDVETTGKKGGLCMLVAGCITYFVMQCITLSEIVNAPEECPHEFKVSMTVLASIQIGFICFAILIGLCSSVVFCLPQ